MNADLPTYPLTVEGVEQALAALDKGGSEDVAIRLQELGFRGAPDCEGACPVAQYLLTVVPGLDYALVEASDVFYQGGGIDEDGFYWSTVPWHTTLPDAVSAFVEDFDQGIYPELIEKTEEVKTDG